ncbi:MAG: hypothetical protein F4Z54_06255 [Acidimicrobiaceae bacterium]|nr:hypothetical protein [Acidimicrobiaceae bacterium]MXW89124.1 hypothetical protein [Acidimicrobiaceae bacterium]
MDREEAVVSSIGKAVQRCANWPVALAALVGVAGCVAGLAWRQTRLEGMGLDTRGWYTPEEAAALFIALDRLDSNATVVYAVTALTIDMVFPVCYGLLLAVGLFRLFPGGAPLYLLPLALALADVLENATVAVLALSHDGTPSSLAWPAAVFTLAKTVLIAATLAATATGAALRLWAAIRR